MRMNGWVTVCVAGLVIAGIALAQTPDITSFHANGQLTWTNNDTNLFYQIEWAASLAASNAWRSDYSSLRSIRSTNGSTTVSVPMFYRVSANSNRSEFGSYVARTGQTNSFLAGDDGQWVKGIASPVPRFTVQADTNCVLDNLTGLMWARNANLAGYMSLASAITYCTNLTWGGYQDWRVPNVRELQSLLDFGQSSPIVPAGNPFLGVQSDHYWSSTATPWDGTVGYIVHMGFGRTIHDFKSIPWGVWPVRGGQ